MERRSSTEGVVLLVQGPSRSTFRVAASKEAGLNGKTVQREVMNFGKGLQRTWTPGQAASKNRRDPLVVPVTPPRTSAQTLFFRGEFSDGIVDWIIVENWHAWPILRARYTGDPRYIAASL